MLLRKTGLLVALLLYFITLTLGELVCPKRIPCTCRAESVQVGHVEYQHRIVDCSNNGLRHVPNLLPLSGRFYHQLLLNGNRISHVPKHSFTSLSIRSIDLSDNPLRSISDKAFELIAGLKELLLRNCSLRTAPIALRYSPRLTHLDLSHNKIHRLVPWSVSNLYHLQELDISGNSVQFPWPFYAFENMKKMRKLRVAKNGLINLPKPALEQLPNLEILDLSDNNITGWNPEDLDLVPKLRDFDLRKNPIKIVSESGIFRSLIRLTSLQMSHCHIPKLTTDLFPKENNITLLSLSWCNVSSIESGLFHNFQTLKYLDISGNPLFILEEYFIGLEETLEILKVNNMHLGTLAFSHMTGFNKLRHLHANENDLHWIRPGTFRNVLKPNLHLYLNNNNITKIHTLAFDVIYFPVWLYLRGNNIADLDFLIRQPCRFIGLNLDIRDNPINCNCDLFKMEDMKIVNMSGECREPFSYRGKKLSWRPGDQNKDDYFLHNASDYCPITTHFAQRFECTCGYWLRHDNVTKCSNVILGLSSSPRLIYSKSTLFLSILCISVIPFIT